MQTFSERYNFKPDNEPEITVRYDAPEELRGVVILLADNSGVKPAKLRDVLCKVLLKRPNQNNWTEYPNIDNENHQLLDGAVWYKVYDVVEAVSSALLNSYNHNDYDQFELSINNYFIESGVGWKLTQGRLSVRNPESLEQTVKSAISSLENSSMPTAKKELHEALKDLSKRPKPDITGAIQHSMAALECVMREVSGNTKVTLGELIKKQPGIVPSPLDQAITKLWGFASEYGRHLQEGREPEFKEAQLVVGCCASLITYLSEIKNQSLIRA